MVRFQGHTVIPVIPSAQVMSTISKDQNRNVMEWIQEELLAAAFTTQGLNWDRRFLQGSINDFQELAFPQMFRHV
jgi:Na+/H+ antiporter NhaA